MERKNLTNLNRLSPGAIRIRRHHRGPCRRLELRHQSHRVSRQEQASPTQHSSGSRHFAEREKRKVCADWRPQ